MWTNFDISTSTITPEFTVAQTVQTLASNENRDTGMFSGPPWTSKCLHPALASR